MYCFECGTQIPDNSKFCSQCGHKQYDSAPSVKEKITDDRIEKGITRQTAEIHKPSLDYLFFKKSMRWYLAWAIIHLGILLIFSEGIFTHASKTDDFWPFDDGSAYDTGIGEYDIREFLFYTISFFLILIIWSMARTKSNSANKEINPK